MMRNYKSKAPWLLALAVSIFLHLWGLNILSLPVATADQSEPEDVIELYPLPEKPPPKHPQQPSSKLHGQVVDLGPADPNDTTPPPEVAKYLSERNMRTDRETVRPSTSRTGGPGRPTSLPQPSHTPTKKNSDRVNPGLQDNRESMTKHGLDRNDGTMELDKAKPENITREDLMLSMADIQQMMEGDNGSIDYVPDAVVGDFTSLNASRYTYAAFYNRIKKIIRFYWEPDRAVQQIGWHGATLETRLDVVILADGSLESVEVAKSCGYPVVDSAAIRAIRKAAPFYNVPPGLLNEQGKLEDSWSFTIVGQ